MKKLFFTLSLLAFPLAGQAQFSDTDGHPYQEAIQYAQENGIVNGYPDGSFKPDDQINRAEFVKIIIEAEFTAEEIESCDLSLLDRYTDLNQEEWYASFICLATDEGIIEGYPDGTFKPEQMVNFVVAAKVIGEAFGYDDYPEDDFWFRDYVDSLSSSKAIPLSITDLKKIITRGEIIEIIWRYTDSSIDKTQHIKEEYRFIPKNSLELISAQDFIKNSFKFDSGIDSNYSYLVYNNKAYFDYGHKSYSGLYLLTDADADSFEYLGNIVMHGGYLLIGRDDNHVYRYEELMPGIEDPATYSLVDNGDVILDERKTRISQYGKDQYFGYYNFEIIPESDGQTFELYSCGNRFAKSCFAFDKNNVYYGKNILEEADPDSFRIINSSLDMEICDHILSKSFSRDDKHLYIDAIKVDSQNIDLDTFETLDCEHYAKDSKNAYYFDINNNNTGDINDDILIFRKINNAQLETFEIIEKEEKFSRDQYSLYYQGDKIEGIANPNEVKIIDKIAYHLVNDSEKIYLMSDYTNANQDRIIQENIKDPLSFENIPAESAFFSDYFQDQNNIYYCNNQTCITVENIDKDSIEFYDSISHQDYIKDKDNVFYQGRAIKGADPATFDPA
jgi:hypothetical protein